MEEARGSGPQPGAGAWAPSGLVGGLSVCSQGATPLGWHSKLVPSSLGQPVWSKRAAFCSFLTRYYLC